ncbi:MAG: hypothetical protein GY946_04960 [bacterium]|nr:hypothetical protein [bacterium]
MSNIIEGILTGLAAIPEALLSGILSGVKLTGRRCNKCGRPGGTHRRKSPARESSSGFQSFEPFQPPAPEQGAVCTGGG